MTTTASQITVNTSPVLIVSSGSQYQEITIHATGTIYLGGSTVTTSNGYRMDNGDKITFTLAPNLDFYAVSNAGSSTTYVLVTLL